MQIETEIQRVVQLLLKGREFEQFCINGEDTWYDKDQVIGNELISNLLSTQSFIDLCAGNIDFVVCRGNY